MLIIQSLLFVILILMAWQDFKFRAVYWWLFPLLLMALAMIKIKENNWSSLSNDLLYNGLFLGGQILFLTLYFSIKERRRVNIFKAYFGLGDLFFLCCITVYFSFLNYILFYIISLLAIILLTLFTQVMLKKTNPKIPLAGWQAILLLVFLVVDGYGRKIDFTTDLGLVNYLGF